MSMNSYIEMHDYYLSVLKIRLGINVLDNIYEKVNDSEYYQNVAYNFKSKEKFPSFVQILMLTKADLNQKRKINKSIDLMEALVLLNFFHVKINKKFELKSEEEMITTLKRLVQEYEHLNYSMGNEI